MVVILYHSSYQLETTIYVPEWIIRRAISSVVAVCGIHTYMYMYIQCTYLTKSGTYDAPATRLS